MRLLLVTCLIIGLSILAHARCPPGMPPERCHNQVSGGFRRGLIRELLERKNLKVDDLDDTTLKRALNLLLEDERMDDGGQQDNALENEERQPPERALHGEVEERARSDERLRELLLKLLRKEQQKEYNSK